MFDFGIIICSNGVEVIDRTVMTDYEELSPLEMEDYTELDAQLFMLDMMERKRRREAERSGDGKPMKILY